MNKREVEQVRRLVEDARLQARLMRPSGYRSTAMREDVEYERGLNNGLDALLNMVETTKEPTGEMES